MANNINARSNNNIHDNLCAAIKSLSSENKYAFAPFLSSEEHQFLEEATVIRNAKFMQEMVYWCDNPREVLKSLATSSGPERAKICDDKNPSVCNEARAVASLITRTLNKVTDQMKECYGYDAKLHVEVRVQNYCRVAHEFHRDPDEGPDDGIKLSLALAGKSTAFITDQMKFSYEDVDVDVEYTPDLHLAVFTTGFEEQKGAVHSSPQYANSEEDCSRILLFIWGPKMDAMHTEL